MKIVIFTYDSRARGEEGEACTNILLEDEQASIGKDLLDRDVLQLGASLYAFCDIRRVVHEITSTSAINLGVFGSAEKVVNRTSQKVCDSGKGVRSGHLAMAHMRHGIRAEAEFFQHGLERYALLFGRRFDAVGKSSGIVHGIRVHFVQPHKIAQRGEE